MNYEVIIIGAGPAGLTAAIYSCRAGLKTMVVESSLNVSQIALTGKIENYPGFPEGISGVELLERFKKQAEKFGAEFVSGELGSIRKNERLWEINVDGRFYSSLCLIIASGARPKELGVPGEKELKGKGVSYCATCDAAFFRNKDVAVVGGGDSAAEEAMLLTKFAKKVIVIHRRDQMRAAKILQDRLKGNKKVEFFLGYTVKEIVGEDRVRAIKIVNVKNGQEEGIPVEGVFMSVGTIPNTEFAKGLVDLDQNGKIVVDQEMKTSREGIFACGDCRNTVLRQVITACSDGAIASMSCQRYIEGLK